MQKSEFLCQSVYRNEAFSMRLCGPRSELPRVELDERDALGVVVSAPFEGCTVLALKWRFVSLLDNHSPQLNKETIADRQVCIVNMV